MIIVNLEELLKEKEISAILNILLESNLIGIYNHERILKLGTDSPSSERDYPIKINDNLIGWVKGKPEKKANAIARFLSNIARQKWENKLLTNDSLDQYEKIIFIYEFLRQISVCSSLSALLELVTEEIKKHTNTTTVLIFVFDSESNELNLCIEREGRVTFDSILKPNQTINKYVVASKKAEIINNLKLDRRYVEEETIGLSLIAAPLIVYDRVIGAIDLINEKTDAYTTEDLKLLNLLTFPIAAAIQTALLSQDNQDYFYILEDSLVKWTFALEKANKQLQKLALVDELTQITNRRGFEQYFNREYRRMKREKKSLSLIIADVDYFKNYNDRYGHKAGDLCLKQIAQTINSSLKRAGDLVCRYGGEEFAIILPDTDSYGAVHLAETIREQIQQLNIIHESSSVSGVITLSLGIATTMATRASQPDMMIKAADRALYQAKQQGRDRYRFLFV